MEPLRSGLIELWTELRQLLGSDIDELRRRGDVPPWVDPDAMSALLVAVANGLVLQATVDPDGPGLPDMAGRFGGLGRGRFRSRLFGSDFGRTLGRDFRDSLGLDLFCGRSVAVRRLAVRGFARSLAARIGTRHRRDDLVREPAETTIERELHFGLGTTVRDEEVFELARVHAPLDLVDHGLVGHTGGLEHAQDRPASPVELLECGTTMLDASNEALGQSAGLVATDSTDVGCAETGVDQLEDGAHVPGRRRELARQMLQDGSCSHGTRWAR